MLKFEPRNTQKKASGWVVGFLAAKNATFAKFLGGVDMDIESIGKDILDCAYAIHTRFGSCKTVPNLSSFT